MSHPAIPRSPIEKSSNVAAAGYDPVTQTLAVEFKNGGIYHYAGVSAQQFQALQHADSFGKHLAAHIRGKHASTHINPKAKD